MESSPHSRPGDGEREVPAVDPPPTEPSTLDTSSAPPPGTEERAPAQPPPSEEEPESDRKWGPLHFLRELPGLIIIALVLALLIKSFLVQAFFIPSESMVPTLKVGDRVLVNKVLYRFREPRRGEIIVFENPNLVDEDRNPVSAFWHWVTEGLGFSTDPDRDFIKRVIGIPGDTVEVKGGQVFVNGNLIEEPYLVNNRDRSDQPPVQIGERELFVMGDNRANSQDSRQFGPIDRDKVVGKAFIILWPPSRFEWLGGDD